MILFNFFGVSNFLQVIHKATHWINTWSSLHHVEVRESLASGCNHMEMVARAMFNRFGCCNTPIFAPFLGFIWLYWVLVAFIWISSWLFQLLAMRCCELNYNPYLPHATKYFPKPCPYSDGKILIFLLKKISQYYSLTEQLPFP